MVALLPRAATLNVHAQLDEVADGQGRVARVRGLVLMVALVVVAAVGRAAQRWSAHHHDVPLVEGATLTTVVDARTANPNNSGNASDDDEPEHLLAEAGGADRDVVSCR